MTLDVFPCDVRLVSGARVADCRLIADEHRARVVVLRRRYPAAEPVDALVGVLVEGSAVAIRGDDLAVLDADGERLAAVTPTRKCGCGAKRLRGWRPPEGW